MRAQPLAPRGVRALDRYEQLIFSAEGHVARVSLNCPAQLSATSEQLYLELRHALTRAQCDNPLEFAVLTGNGARFCAGGDRGGPGRSAVCDVSEARERGGVSAICAAKAFYLIVAGVSRPCATFRMKERAGHPLPEVRAPRATSRKGRA